MLIFAETKIDDTFNEFYGFSTLMKSTSKKWVTEIPFETS